MPTASRIYAPFTHHSVHFFEYASYVKRRNDKIVKAAARSNAIVSSLFPSNIRDRLFKAEDDKKKDQNWKNAPKSGLKGYLRDDGDVNGKSDHLSDSKPLADLFPETTIMVSTGLNVIVKLPRAAHFLTFNFSFMSVCRYRGLHSMEFRPRAHASVCSSRDTLRCF